MLSLIVFLIRLYCFVNACVRHRCVWFETQEFNSPLIIIELFPSKFLWSFLVSKQAKYTPNVATHMAFAIRSNDQSKLTRRKSKENQAKLKKKDWHTHSDLCRESNLNQHTTTLYKLEWKEKKDGNVKDHNTSTSTMTHYQPTRWRWYGFPLHEKLLFVLVVLWSKLPMSPHGVINHRSFPVPPLRCCQSTDLRWYEQYYYCHGNATAEVEGSG